MLLSLPYGNGFETVEIPDDAKVVYPRESPGVGNGRAEIRRALDHPLGCMPLLQLAQGKSDATVVINDITRPAPSGLMLEELLADLEAAGIGKDAISIIIACGNHRPNTSDEIEKMVGSDLASRLKIVNHDCQEEAGLTSIGKTRRGLPISINSLYTKASLKILTGIITPHHVAGYSGGRKSLIPGIAGLETLKGHHSFPIRPYEPALGWMKNNPFHEEAVEAAQRVGVDFILNVVKNSDGQVVKAVAGELQAAHEYGVSICKESSSIEFPKRYDVVIVTPGGYPRDINLHQAQKAISTAELLVEEKGVIVLVAECREGIGKFGEQLKQAKTPREVIERFRNEGFTEDHSSKAFMCARALDKFTIIVSCSGIEKDELEDMFFRYAPSPQAAVEDVLKLKASSSSVLVLPYAGNCVPNVTSRRMESEST